MKTQNGFTLLEVLVASLILFMAIALVSLTYRTGLNAERAAEKKVFKSVVVRFIQQAIVEELRVRPGRNSGDGQWGELSYQWEVKKESGKWSKSGFDIETNTQVEMGRQLELKDINIDVEGEIYEFTHLSWK
mgnify:CR=1 FL=1